MSPRKAASPKPAVAVSPKGIPPASTAGSAADDDQRACGWNERLDPPIGAVADEMIAAAAHAAPDLDDPWQQGLDAQAGIATLTEFLAVEKGVAFAAVETPQAIVLTAMNVMRGQIPALDQPTGYVTTAQLEQALARLQYVDESIRIAKASGEEVRRYLLEHFGIAPDKIGTAPLLAGAIINQFRSLEQQLAKALGKGS